MDAESRAYFNQVLGAFRDDVSREFGALRQEFGTVREEFGTLRGEFGTVRGEFEALRQDVRLGTGLSTEMNERFAATHAVVRVAFQEVRWDIEDLRTSL